MEFISNNYFGLTGFLVHMSHFIPKKTAPIATEILEEEAAPSAGRVERQIPFEIVEPPSAYLEKIKREAPHRLACAVGAYYALPVFAALGGMFQLSLCLYKGWTRIFIPLVRRSPCHLETPLQECSEHLVRSAYNMAIYFFRRSAAFSFLSPYDVLWIHHQLEGELICPLDRSEEELVDNPNIIIRKCARYFTGIMLKNLRPEDDLTIQAKEGLRKKASQCYNRASNLFRLVSTRFFAAQPG
jgi:hypothetical protein